MRQDSDKNEMVKAHVSSNIHPSYPRSHGWVLSEKILISNYSTLVTNSSLNQYLSFHLKHNSESLGPHIMPYLSRRVFLRQLDFENSRQQVYEKHRYSKMCIIVRVW